MLLWLAAANQFLSPASHSVAGLFLSSQKHRLPLVGASLLAMDVNDDATNLIRLVVIGFFASRLAPTGVSGVLRRSQWRWSPPSVCLYRHSRHRSRSAPAPVAPV